MSRAVGIIGASGFTGAELLRLCALHPELEVRLATGDSQAGRPIAELYPSLAAGYGERAFDEVDLDAAAACELVFLGLPHGASQSLVPELLDAVPHVVDLAADFRLKDAALYPDWYGEAHEAPELLDRFVYGLPELDREPLRGAATVAVPGCYPTSAILGLAPFVRAGLVATDGIIVDAASGVSGAGRPPKPTTTFCTVDEDFTAYGLLRHRHTPEIEQGLGRAAAGGTDVRVLFTPHLAPMNRGILATCYATPTADLDTESALDVLRSAYDDEPFVVVSERSPSTKATFGSNSAHVTARVDPRTGHLLVLTAIDNLVKGASGQAVQCANLALGLDEPLGLPAIGTFP